MIMRIESHGVHQGRCLVPWIRTTAPRSVRSTSWLELKPQPGSTSCAGCKLHVRSLQSHRMTPDCSSGRGTDQPTDSSISSPLPGLEDSMLNLRECRHFVNLTNGIESLPMLHDLGLPYSFVRIQSTSCEQQNLEALMNDLDPTLLLSLALGHICLVYDCGSRGHDGLPRALWYGLEFIRYALSKLWLGKPCTALLNGRNVVRHFDSHICSFRQSTTRRLKYYSKYVPPGVGTDMDGGEEGHGGGGDGDGRRGQLQQLRLYGVYRPTDKDEDVSHFVRLLYRHELPHPGTAALTSSRQSSSKSLISHPSQQQSQLLCCQQPRAGERPSPDHPVAVTGVPASHWQDEDRVVAALEHAQEVSEEDDGAVSAAVAGTHCKPDMLVCATANGSGGEANSAGGASSDFISGKGEGRDGSGAGLAPCAVTSRLVPAVDGDGEAQLAVYGFRLFRRGLSPVEWSARGAAALTMSPPLALEKPRPTGT